MVKKFKGASKVDADAISKAWDADGDGQVTFDEFKARLAHFAAERPEFLARLRKITAETYAAQGPTKSLPQLVRRDTFAEVASLAMQNGPPTPLSHTWAGPRQALVQKLYGTFFFNSARALVSIVFRE